jgi:hypothetical protein
MQTLYLYFGTSLRLESIFSSYLDIENYRLAHISTLTFDFHKMHWFYRCTFHADPLSIFWHISKTREYFLIISGHRELSIGTYFNTDLWLSQNASVYTTPMHVPITNNPLSIFWHISKTREHFFIISRHRELSIGTYFNSDLWLSQNALVYTTPMHVPITKNLLSIFWHISKTREYLFIISRHRELSIGTYFNSDLWLSQNALVLQVHVSWRPFIYFLAHL